MKCKPLLDFDNRGVWLVLSNKIQRADFDCWLVTGVLATEMAQLKATIVILLGN